MLSTKKSCEQTPAEMFHFVVFISTKIKNEKCPTGLRLFRIPRSTLKLQNDNGGNSPGQRLQKNNRD